MGGLSFFWVGGGGRKEGNPLCDAMAFDSFQWPKKCKSIKISILEIRVQRCITQIAIPNDNF